MTEHGKVPNLNFQVKLIHTLLFIYYQYSALGPVWAATRSQSGDRYGSGTMRPGQVLRGSLPLLSPRLDVPTFTARCLHVRNDTRDSSSERWNHGREGLSAIRDLLHAANL